MNDQTAITTLALLIVFLIMALCIVAVILLDLQKRVSAIERILPNIPRRYKA